MYLWYERFVVDTSSFLTLSLALLAGALAGAGLYAWWRHTLTSSKMRMPDKWPIKSRVVLSHEECEVHKWLSSVFHDHLVMVKVPVLRFTEPISKDKNGGGMRWQQLLEGVYCTFTVCTSNGHVVGCVDVPSKRGISKANRDLKESLLADCRIAYTSARSIKLPNAAAMRAAFLGEVGPGVSVTRGGDSSFNAALDTFTKDRRMAIQNAALKELNDSDGPKIKPRPQVAGV